jgi:uncharacterized protein (TIGR02118 family)
MIKLIYCLTRREGLSFEQFRTYWSGEHAALVRRHAGALGIFRYVQSHTVAHDANAALRENRQTLPPYDGVAEIYFKDLAALAQGNLSPQAQAAQAELTADEDRFIDRSRSTLFVSEETIVIGSATS